MRLFHLYVHEPLMRDGVPGLEMAEEMEGLAREMLPLSSPVMDAMHQRFLAHFVAQDVVGHMEIDLEDTPELGRLRVAVAFADLAGYTRLTEELGDEQAVDAVDRFVAAVEHTLPDDARIVKTIGDEVMIVGTDIGALTDWAVGFQEFVAEMRPLPRIGVHAGDVLYRDGDYYGRNVNLAARVVARSAGGEVLCTRPVVDAGGAHLRFTSVGEVRLKGFSDVTEMFLASPATTSLRRMEDVLERVRATGLLSEGQAVVVLLSGGRDSVCLLDCAVAARRRRHRAARELRPARRRRR